MQPANTTGRGTVSNAVTTMTSDVGTRTQQAQINRDAQALIQKESVMARDNANGVNLDEEAAELMREGLARPAIAADRRLGARIRAALGINLLRMGREDEGLTELRASFEASRFNVRVANLLAVLARHPDEVPDARPDGGVEDVEEEHLQVEALHRPHEHRLLREPAA